MSSKTMQGVVVSNRMAKTVVVKVTLQKTHPKYHKKYTRNKKYKAHDENNEYQVGDIVEVAAARPLSKEKRWKVVKKVK